MTDDSLPGWHAIDPLWVDRPSRSHYSRIFSILNSRIGPSYPVRTGDLANVVNGREDVPLPSWATDRMFELELEDLIRTRQTILICVDCDHVIGFLAYAPESSDIKPSELMYVASRQGVACPFCGSSKWAIGPSNLLTTGRQAELPPEVRVTMAGRTGPAKTSVDSEQSAGNERYLDSVLRRLYPFQRGEPTTHISLDPSDIAMCAALAEQLSPSMGSASERLAPVLHLRPVSNAEYSNVLGVVWNKVKQMAVPDYLFVTEVAVGILPRNQITGSAHYGPNAELAIVLHLGLFRRLYSLNLTMLRILAAHSASDAAQLRKLLGRLRIGVLPDHSGLDPEEPLYKSEKDFRVVDAISKIQQEFVVLHELGHIHGWLAESSRAAGRDSSAASEEGEFSADDWAFGLVLRRGGKFHRLDLYIRALLWLFEYWRAISPGVASLGRRWHRIVAVAERSGLRLPPSEVGITQQLFDSAFERGSP